MEQRHEIIQFSSRVPGRVFLHRLGSVPKHWHRSIELLFVLSGAVNIVVDDRSYTVGSTDVMIVNSLATHELYGQEAEMVAFQINLSKSPVYDVYKNACFDCCSAGDSHKERYDYLRHLLARLIKVNSMEENVLLSHSLISLLLYELVSNFQVPQPEGSAVRQKALRQMAQITDYIRAHFDEGIGLSDVAKQFHFSQSYLSRFFKQNMNMTFTEYHNRLRLEHAVNEMLTSSESIADIAAHNGFSDARSFVSLFKKHYGMLPSEYRSSHSSVIPADKMRNEINYLSVTSSTSLSVLAKYLEEDAYRLKDREKRMPSRRLDIGSVSVGGQGQALRHTWRNVCCVGSTRELLYADVQEMIRKMQREMPFSYVKFHGLLSDDMMLYHELKNGEISLSFTVLDKVFDFLRSVGLKPMMQFFVMPQELALDPDNQSFFVRQNTSLPKDMDRWCALIAGVVRHCVERYGLAEVRTWPFSLWNEPDTNPDMFGFGFEHQEDFLEFYRRTYAAVKGIDETFIFGSPSLLFLPEDPLHWYQPFFDFCRREGCVPDFLNIHFYDDDIEVVEGFTEGTSIVNRLSADEHSFARYIDMLYENLDRFGLRGKPIYMTEWNLTVSHRNLINDTCFKSCYLTKNLLENYDRLESFGYWSLTDFLGELQLPQQVFHGGLGMFTFNGIPKAHYNTFVFASRLGDVELSRGSGWFLTRRSADSAAVLLLYNYQHYDRIFSAGEVFDMTPTNRYTAFSELMELEVVLTWTDLPGERCRLRETFVNREWGSSFDAWAAMGAPDHLTAEDESYLAARAQPGRQVLDIKTAGGTYVYRRRLKPLEVRLVELIPV